MVNGTLPVADSRLSGLVTYERYCKRIVALRAGWSSCTNGRQAIRRHLKTNVVLIGHLSSFRLLAFLQITQFERILG